ncbi:Imm51 family immunity protein [Micromonospora craterilacus]|uniref:Imm51 family immunity protein n=1 Tax=Micromonospora craterilacus TaxID=1655439 RepID=UPI001F47F7C6|nr:Imm51 family immunity protein [Micromonospora craterilacus]
MDPIEIETTESGGYSLWLEAGTTDVDDVIRELGHEPNGYFWEGVAELLVASEAASLGGRFSSDPEAGAFCAYSDDRAALEDLAARLRKVATEETRVRQLVDLATATGFEFDD